MPFLVEVQALCLRNENHFLFFAFLGHCIGCTKTSEEGNTAAHRSGLVASLTVTGESRDAVASLRSFLAALEQTILCHGSEAGSEDDGECQC